MPTVSNTSPISNLACIGRLELLREQFGTLWIPSAVQAELANIPDSTVRRTVEQAITAGWIRVDSVKNGALLSLLTVGLHVVEAETIALAAELQAERVLVDERDGRKIARQLGLRVTGVLGVLLRAKKVGRISVIKPEIDALRK